MEVDMVMAAGNALAMVRFASIRALHGTGGEFSLVVLGLALFGVVAWALSRTSRSDGRNS
jgi:hypothetical protein